jgi:Phospholipase_D-nuclease N-terminal
MTPLAASAFTWVFILLPFIVVWVIGVVDIVRRPLSLPATAGWILFVLVLPLIGTLVYFLLRKPTQEELRLQRLASSGAPYADAADAGPRPPVD